MLDTKEEVASKKYMLDMAEYGHSLSIEQLRLKVALMTQERATPFTDGIPRRRWLYWFKNIHLDITIRQVQGLEITHAKGLCAKNVASFLRNLQHHCSIHAVDFYRMHCMRSITMQHAVDFYSMHCMRSITIQQIRFGTIIRAVHRLGKMVEDGYGQKGTRAVHTLLSNEREWLTVLTCINAAGHHILGFYIFRGLKIRDNYIRVCKDGAAMAM